MIVGFGLAGSIIGYVGLEGTGLWGIEADFDGVLKGKPGLVGSERYVEDVITEGDEPYVYDLVLGYDRGEVRPRYRGALLAPWPNRVVDGRYHVDGEELQLDHGEVHPWEVGHDAVDDGLLVHHTPFS